MHVSVCVFVWVLVLGGGQKKICSKLRRCVLVAMATAESTADVNVVSVSHCQQRPE